ncbi:TIGR03087 family PEP-CTERM/XrtA system glycosyltransferase [Rhodocyclaceae bacterium SMB388]
MRAPEHGPSHSVVTQPSESLPPLLYLVHRIPYPPNKGDKLRSFNILRQLAKRHRVYLGTFVDDPDDLAHVARLREWCADVFAVTIDPHRARIASLRGLLTGEALSLPYYRDAGMRRWVTETVAAHGIRDALAFSGPMAQYLDAPGLTCRVIDFCDLDSSKWTQYAPDRSWPMSWLYRREGERLLAFERQWAERVDASTFVTEAEADLLRHQLPAVANRIHAVQNGVDAEFFSPAHAFESPYPAGGPVIVFTGAMDYWPNIDAVTWFVNDILPGIRAELPAVRFTIVGMNPAPAVQALAGSGVVVTGKVPDVRPWIAHADLIVAPLRIARGIQNKVLEAMAMGKPVVVSAASATGLDGEVGHDFVTAVSAAQFIDTCLSLLGDPERRKRVAASARECVEQKYSWQAHLTRFDQLLDAS